MKKRLTAGWVPAIREAVSGDTYIILSMRDAALRSQVRRVVPLVDDEGLNTGYLIGDEVSMTEAIDLLISALQYPVERKATIRVFDTWEQFKPLPNGGAQ